MVRSGRIWLQFHQLGNIGDWDLDATRPFRTVDRYICVCLELGSELHCAGADTVTIPLRLHESRTDTCSGLRLHQTLSHRRTPTRRVTRKREIMVVMMTPTDTNPHQVAESLGARRRAGTGARIPRSTGRRPRPGPRDRASGAVQDMDIGGGDDRRAGLHARPPASPRLSPDHTRARLGVALRRPRFRSLLCLVVTCESGGYGHGLVSSLSRWRVSVGDRTVGVGRTDGRTGRGKRNENSLVTRSSRDALCCCLFFFFERLSAAADCGEFVRTGRTGANWAHDLRPEQPQLGLHFLG